MYGFPKRAHRPQRSAPVAPRFDPSGDVRCTGWWRADRGAAVNALGAVASWASIIPPYQAFTPTSGLPALYLPRFTHGFPAISMGYGSGSYVANQLAHDGDRSMTLTLVMRFPYAYTNNGNTFLYLGGQDLQLALWDSWVRVWATNNWRDWTNNTFYPCGTAAVAVLTARVRPISDPGDLRQQWYFTYNAQQLGPFNNDTGRTSAPASELRINSQYRGMSFWHEIIYFRDFLSDVDVARMHTLLLQQYGASS